MNQRDLAYWAQGFFEIHDARKDTSPRPIGEGPRIFPNSIDFDENQWAVVAAHTDLVEHDEGTQGPLVVGLRLANDAKNTTLARQVVASFFKHVIDPADPHPETSQIVHDSGFHRPPSNPTIYRC